MKFQLKEYTGSVKRDAVRLNYFQLRKGKVRGSWITLL